MKTNLSDIVSKYLFSYGSVGIPGIGTFSISESSSGFKLENDILTPPTRMIDFSEDVSNEDALVKYLKNNHDYSRKEAEKKLSDYSKGFLNDLLNYGVANIPGIGRLTKYASGEIVFDPAKEYLITSNYMLPELKLTPIDNTGVVKEILPETITAPKIPAVAAIAGAVPTAATTAAFLGDDKPDTSPKSEVAPPKSPPAPVDKPAVGEKVKKEIKPKPAVKEEPVSTPIRETPPPVVYEEERSFLSEWKWPLLIGILLLGSLMFGVKMCNQYMSGEGLGIKNPIANLTDKVSEKVKGKKDAKVASLEEYLKENPSLQKYAKELTQENVDNGCVIIVGTYRKSRNVIRMKDKLVRAGLSPYTELHKGMTRVGIMFPCEDQDLDEYINSIRKAFDRGAWYLSPPISVARR